MIQRLRLFVATLLMGGSLAVLGLVPIVSAETTLFDNACTAGDTGGSTVCQDSLDSQDVSDNSIYGPDGIITKIANIVAIVAGIAAIIVIIIAGIQYMLSTGDPTKVNNAKNAILYALIGLVVVMLARTLVVFVIGKL